MGKSLSLSSDHVPAIHHKNYGQTTVVAVSEQISHLHSDGDNDDDDNDVAIKSIDQSWNENCFLVLEKRSASRDGSFRYDSNLYSQGMPIRGPLQKIDEQIG